MRRREFLKSGVFAWGAFLFSAMLLGCRTPVLELPEIQFLRIEANATKTELTISGLAFHSAYAVGDTQTHRKGDALLVKLPLVRPGKGFSGTFTRQITIVPEVQRVLFGDRQAEIWNRVNQ
jgi:hypothetical protein